MTDYAKRAPGVYVEQVASGSAPIAGVGTSTAGFIGVVPESVATPGHVELITNFTEFKNKFGDFSPTDAGQSILAHAVYGFFNNGGTRCYVTTVAPLAASGTTGGTAPSAVDIAGALELFEPIDEIAIVAAPGMTDAIHYSALEGHCARVETRFAILDTPLDMDDFGTALAENSTSRPPNSDYAAVYFPWIQVFDPAKKTRVFVPPSGHMAGIYARVDAGRGVHKAPANEVVQGALDLRYAISRSQQDGLNPQGINCIRRLNGNIKVWGARTVGGEKNLDFRYINVRRLFNYLRGSIDQGTQWAVFEPNNQDLWAKITRNVGAFLNIVWTSGALFGDTAAKAYYVKCDEETNPPEVRDLGMVVTEIGVAITRPAEFVVFRLGQKAAS